MAEVGLLFAASIPLCLYAIDVEVALVGILIKPYIVKDKKLRLRTNEAGVGNARALEIVGGLAGDIAGIARIVLACDRVLNVADHGERGDRHKRINNSGVGHGHQQHVALVDGLPAPDTRSIKSQTVFEDILFEFSNRDREVLPRAEKISKPKIDCFHFLLATHRKHFTGLHRSFPECGWCGAEGDDGFDIVCPMTDFFTLQPHTSHWHHRSLRVGAGRRGGSL